MTLTNRQWYFICAIAGGFILFVTAKAPMFSKPSAAMIEAMR